MFATRNEEENDENLADVHFAFQVIISTQRACDKNVTKLRDFESKFN